MSRKPKTYLLDSIQYPDNYTPTLAYTHIPCIYGTVNDHIQSADTIIKIYFCGELYCSKA